MIGCFQQQRCRGLDRTHVSLTDKSHVSLMDKSHVSLVRLCQVRAEKRCGRCRTQGFNIRPQRVLMRTVFVRFSPDTLNGQVFH